MGSASARRGVSAGVPSVVWPVIGLVTYDARDTCEDGIPKALSRTVSTYVGVVVMMTNRPKSTHVVVSVICAEDDSDPAHTTVHVAMPGVLIPDRLNKFVHDAVQVRLVSACVDAKVTAASTPCVERIQAGIASEMGSPTYGALHVVHVVRTIMNLSKSVSVESIAIGPDSENIVTKMLNSIDKQPWPLAKDSDIIMRSKYVDVTLRPGSKTGFFSTRSLYNVIPAEYQRYTTWTSTKNLISKNVIVDGPRPDPDAHIDLLKPVLEYMMKEASAHLLCVNTDAVTSAMNVPAEPTASTPPMQSTLAQSTRVELRVANGASDMPSELANPESHPIEADEATKSPNKFTSLSVAIDPTDVANASCANGSGASTSRSMDLLTTITNVVQVHSCINRVVVLGDGRKFYLTNRAADGWFNASHMRGLFDTKYALGKAIANAVTKLGLETEANVEKNPNKNTWISREVARELVPEEANEGEPFVERTEEIEEPVSDDSIVLTLQKVMDSIRRVPDGEPCAGWGSVYDVIRLVTKHGDNNIAKDKVKIFGDIDGIFGGSSRPEVPAKYKFCGTSDETLVAPYHFLLEVVWACPGTFATQFKRWCAKFICRAFAGDETVVEEIRVNREALQVNDRADLVIDIPEAGSVDSGGGGATSSHETQLGQLVGRADDIDVEGVRRGIVYNINDANVTRSQDSTVLVSSHHFLAVRNTELDFFVSPQFGSRNVFYINFVGFELELELPMFEFGYTKDFIERQKGRGKHGFVTSRAQVIFSTGDGNPRLVEDNAKNFFKPFMSKVGSNTEVFFCTKEIMYSRTLNLFHVCSNIIKETWIDAALKLPPFPKLRDIAYEREKKETYKIASLNFLKSLVDGGRSADEVQRFVDMAKELVGVD